MGAGETMSREFLASLSDQFDSGAIDSLDVYMRQHLDDAVDFVADFGLVQSPISMLPLMN